MSYTTLVKRIKTPGANPDVDYDNDGQEWVSVQAYLDYMDGEGAEIPLKKTLVITPQNGQRYEVWNPVSARTFVPKVMGHTHSYNDLTDKPVIADQESIAALLQSASLANNLITADIALPLLGYISQSTHQFVDTSNDDKYKCSGLVYVKGFTTIEFSARAYSEDSDSCQMVFFDSAKNVIPSLDICVNDGITRTIDLTSQDYESVSYIIMSAYMPGWSGSKTYLRVKGSYNFQDFIDKSKLAYKQGFNMFDVNRVERGMGLSSTGVYNVDNQAISSHIVELNEDRGRNGDLFLFNLPVTTYTKRFVYYDEHMNIVAGPSDIAAASTSAQIGCPVAARYFRITFVRATSPLPDEAATANMLKDVMITFQYSMEEYQKYYRNIESVNGDHICAASISNLYKGKKWVCVGDSLTERNNHSAKFYHDYIKEDLGFEVINMGVSGTGYKTRDDVANPTTEGSFYQRVAQIPSDTDVVTVFGSFNDVTQGHTLGTASDTGTSTIGGCINTTIETIYSINPGMRLGIIAPCPWKEMTPANPDAIAYVALLQEICNKNSIPFLDLFHNSGLRPWIKAVRDELYNQDAQTNNDFHGTHPNSKGHELLASKIRGFLQTLI